MHKLSQVVNFGSSNVTLQISIDGLEVNSLQASASTKTLLTSSNVKDENSFQAPNKVHLLLQLVATRRYINCTSCFIYDPRFLVPQVVPVKSQLEQVGEEMDVVIAPHSLTSFDLLINSNAIRTVGFDSVGVSSY